MRRRQFLLLMVLTVAAGLVGGAVSNWILMARTAEAQETKKHEKVVIAEEFRLVDKTGKTLAVLGVRDMFDNEIMQHTGYPDDIINLLGVYPGLFLYDKGGTVRGKFIVDEESQNPSLVLYDNKGAFRMAMDWAGDQPTIEVNGGDGTRARLEGFAKGACLTIRDSDRTQRAVLGNTGIRIIKTGEIRKRAASSLVLFDKEGNVMWEAP